MPPQRSQPLSCSISVRVDFDGWHRWPGAPENRAYLRDYHHHVFSAVCTAPVSHDNREIELHNLRDIVKGRIERMYPEGRLGEASCEQIAECLLDQLPRLSEVTVREDEFHWGTARRGDAQ